jgi:ribosomal protein S18 acetylase RimI-like enzyme
VKIDIVAATSADADAIVRLVHELGESWGEPSGVNADYVRHYLGFPGRVVLLAEAAGEQVGMLVYALDPNLFHAADGCLIEELYVRPAWRGKGVARVLVAHVMAEAARRGWAEVSVSTGKDNAAALALYRGQGLVEEYVLLEKHFPGT